ncbi:molybdenum cofactor biosynthesis protein MoaE [Cryobacterium sp. TMT4-10]|nr:molybdenum cofactor biosynthesis protein MoaE [Cryobacterium sp. TMT4-10]
MPRLDSGARPTGSPRVWPEGTGSASWGPDCAITCASSSVGSPCSRRPHEHPRCFVNGCQGTAAADRVPAPGYSGPVNSGRTNDAPATPPAAATPAENGFARVTEAPLDVAEHVRVVSTGSCGAVVTFIGQVRDHDPDAAGQVTGLDYSAHPDAGRILSEIVARFRAEYPQVNLALSHRIGHLDVGDLALVAAAASAHRGDAFTACERLVECVKAEVPIWKKQYEADGSTGWVGLA